MTLLKYPHNKILFFPEYFLAIYFENPFYSSLCFFQHPLATLITFPASYPLKIDTTPPDTITNICFLFYLMIFQLYLWIFLFLKLFFDGSTIVKSDLMFWILRAVLRVSYIVRATIKGYFQAYRKCLNLLGLKNC